MIIEKNRVFRVSVGCRVPYSILTRKLEINRVRMYVPTIQYTSIRQRRPPQQQQPVVEQNDVESLVSNLVPLANDLAELTFEDNFLSNFEIEQVESYQPLFD